MALIKTDTVTLYDRVITGADPFGAPTFSENPVDVEGVLICPVSTGDVISGQQLYGKVAVYELCIPKGDSHSWEDRTVEFSGQKWQTFGVVLEWMEENTPGDWNRKVKVERYG